MENTTQSSQIAALFERCKLFLNDGDFQSAVQYANRILDIEPNNAEAYALLLCARVHVRSEEVLVYADCVVSEFPEYEKMVRFSTGEAKICRESYPKETIYVRAMGLMRERQFAAAIDEFDKITDYKDADKFAKECDTARKELIYSLAVEAETRKDYDAAQKLFSQIQGYSDASERAEQSRCASVYAKAVAAENNNDYNAAIELYSKIKSYKDSQDRIAKLQIKKNASKKKQNTMLFVISVSVCVLFLLTVFVFIPAGKNIKARKLLAEGEYIQALSIFWENGNTEGVRSVAEAYVTIKDYDNAVELYKSIDDTEGVRSVAEAYVTINEYDKAVALYRSIDDTEGVRSVAKACLANKDYGTAAKAFNIVGDNTSQLAVNAIAELVGQNDDVSDVQKILEDLDAASNLPEAKKCAEIIRNKLKEIAGAYEYKPYSSIRRYEFESDGSWRLFFDYVSQSSYDSRHSGNLYMTLDASLTKVTLISCYSNTSNELKFTSKGVKVDYDYYAKESD